MRHMLAEPREVDGQPGTGRVSPLGVVRITRTAAADLRENPTVRAAPSDFEGSRG